MSKISVISVSVLFALALAGSGSACGYNDSYNATLAFLHNQSEDWDAVTVWPLQGQDQNVSVMVYKMVDSETVYVVDPVSMCNVTVPLDSYCNFQNVHFWFGEKHPCPQNLTDNTAEAYNRL
jgi:hypothetical protein